MIKPEKGFPVNVTPFVKRPIFRYACYSDFPDLRKASDMHLPSLSIPSESHSPMFYLFHAVIVPHDLKGKI